MSSSTITRAVYEHAPRTESDYLFAMADPVEAFHPPRTFGEHLLLAELGRGACARVYAARGMQRYGALYALKVLHAGVGPDAPLAQMFRDESRVARRVRGNHLVQALDGGEHPSPHLVMPIIIGDSLRGLLDGPLPFSVALRIALDICEGLESLHRLSHGGDAAHRDVCPENILVGVDGVARLTDYGIARFSEWTRSQVSRAGSAKGRMAYMAPEQLRSESVSGSADVFALGATLWEALVGRPLFTGASVAEIAGNVLFAAIPSVAAIRRDVPPELDEVLNDALAREPIARIASAGKLGHRLLHTGPPCPREELGAFVAASAADRVRTLRALL